MSGTAQDTRVMLDAIAAALGKPVWRHLHYSVKYGGKCAIKGCNCRRSDCHGVVCGMQQAIDKHAADVRQQVAEEIAQEFERRATGKSHLTQSTYERDVRIAREHAVPP